MTMVIELLTNAIKIDDRSALIGVLMPSCVGGHLGLSTGLASLGLPMGRGRVGEMPFGVLDDLLDPLIPRLCGLFEWNVSIALLSLV